MIIKNKKLLTTIQIIILALLCSNQCLAQTWQSEIVKFGTDGKLTYVSDAEQNKIIDFSSVGYKNSNSPIPSITNIITTLSPTAGDRTAAINSAIQSAASITPDTNGFRGVIKLNAGSYEIKGSILLNVSGVVLRGSGSGTGGTILTATGNTPAQRPVIVAGGGTFAAWKKLGTTQTNITTSFVAVGSKTFDVASTVGFAVGDAIIIYHPSTQAWIDAVDGGATASDPAWKAGSIDIEMNKTITAINGNTITIESAVTNHLNKALSQSYIYKVDKSTTKSLIGLEDFSIDIQNWTDEYLDEAHAWWGVQMVDIEDSWAKNVVAEHFGQSGFQTGTACRITIDNCKALNPVCTINGSQRDNFQVVEWSSDILFTNCFASKARHAFEVSGSSQAGGLYFTDVRLMAQPVPVRVI